jgi:hypothetical protein
LLVSCRLIALLRTGALSAAASTEFRVLRGGGQVLPVLV